MTEAEYRTIFYAIDNVETREKRMCDEYIKFFPERKEHREQDRDLYLVAVQQVRREIERELERLNKRFAISKASNG